MKKSFLLLVFAALLMSCSDTETDPVNGGSEGNKVLLLKVDLLTNAFEGGKELTFPDNNNFTISVDYNPPGDFGDVTLNYEEVGMPIFAGDITWMGLGEITYPESMDASGEFTTIQNPVSQPNESQFSLVTYEETEANIFFEDIDYDAIWAAVDNLAAVKEFRDSNPDAQVNLFLYTPSVGIGNPEEWDWIVILKN